MICVCQSTCSFLFWCFFFNLLKKKSTTFYYFLIITSLLMRFSQLISIEFRTLLYLFFIISKHLHYSIEFGTLAFLCCKEGPTTNQIFFYFYELFFNICFFIFGFLTLLSLSFPYHYLFFFFFFFFQFGLFDGCLIISLIDSLIFPITNKWFEIMGVCATHILSPIVSYGLKWWRYIFVSVFFFFLWLSIRFEIFD